VLYLLNRSTDGLLTGEERTAVKMSFIRLLVGSLMLIVQCVTPGRAQTVIGAVTGTVTDSSGAVIPGATVVVTNVATAVRTVATTDNAGVYSIRFLPIGNYNMEVSAKGFAKISEPLFTLEISQTAKIDAQLSVSANNASVNVNGTLAPILNTTDGSLGLSLSSIEILTIPLNGRNISSVTLFQPGAVATDPTGLTTNNAIERSTFNSDVVTINGNRPQANNYALEGTDINETQNNVIGYNVAPDTIQELRVVQANAPATYVFETNTEVFSDESRVEVDILQQAKLDARCSDQLVLRGIGGSVVGLDRRAGAPASRVEPNRGSKFSSPTDGI
jgi:hypothetical protein